jgi:hypothetical protein
MNLYRNCRNFILPGILLISLFLLAGCDLFGNTSATVSTTPTAQGRTISPTVVSKAPTVISKATVGTNKPGVGPIIIQSPTPVSGGSASSQQVGLADRQLVIENVSRQVDATTGMTTVTIKLEIKNTSGKNIQNLATYYQLVGAEGDMFGLPPDTNGSFFGTVASGSMRSGTIIFQEVPTAAIKKLQLLYRSETAQVVFVPLNA